LTSPLTPQTSSALLRLLDVPDAGRQRVNELDRLRKGLFRASSKGMVAALNRVADLVAVGAGSLDVSTVPPRRLLGLATHGIAGKTTLLRRMSREHRLAVLVATVLALSARATDDALELFDLVMTTELLSKAERESKDEKLRRYPRVSRNAGKLAAAVRVLLEMSEVEPGISLEMVWDLIENAVTRSELRAAVAVIDELVPAGDAELNGQRLEELATVRPPPASDDADRRVRRHRRRCPGVEGDEDPRRAADDKVEAVRHLPGCPPGRSRPDRRRLVPACLPGRPPMGATRTGT